MTTRGGGGSSTLHTPAALDTMSPPRHDASRHVTDTQDDSEALYEIAKQLYSRLKKLKQRYKDLERKNAILKTMHAHVKQELKVARQVDTEIYISL